MAMVSSGLIRSLVALLSTPLDCWRTREAVLLRPQRYIACGSSAIEQTWNPRISLRTRTLTTLSSLRNTLSSLRNSTRECANNAPGSRA
ncbi:hypothetical protein PLICRDRAFT_567434 [Plicaturopsis crispa FD-325 SS-3]|nr:hypothetical protein PLICRDRAFT_567434 [Plicaturopsis crispa FD-325 SS-3]